MRKILCSVFIMFILSWNVAAWGKVYIDINAPGFQKYPIAITDFKNMEPGDDKKNLSAWFAHQLSHNLNLTGFFYIINPGAFLEDQKQTGITIGGINFSDWSSIGADFLVKGGFYDKGNELSVEFRIFDVVEGTLIAGKRYQGKVTEKEIMVLKFVNEILLALTGEKGVFDTKIAFVAKDGTTMSSEIYSIDFDGANLTKITSLESLTMLPQWSPDGGRIFFTSYMNGNPDSYIMNLATKRITELTSFTGLNLASSWSSDGSKLLLVLSKDGNEEIYARDIKKNSLQRLTRNYSIDVSPTWSPDGKKIAFVSNRSGSPQIFTMDSDGGRASRLTYEGSYNTSPSWSPKGNRIAYEGMTTNGQFQIFTIDENGGNLVQLTYESGGGESPSWSPGGMYLTFISTIGGKKKICIINSNGLNLRILGSPGGSCVLDSPSWSSRLESY